MQKKLLRTFKLPLLIGFVVVCAGLPIQTQAMIAELEQEAANYRTLIGCRNCSVYIRPGPNSNSYDTMHFNGIQGTHKANDCTSIKDNQKDYQELNRILLAVRKIESDKISVQDKDKLK